MTEGMMMNVCAGSYIDCCVVVRLGSPSPHQSAAAEEYKVDTLVTNNRLETSLTDC